MNSRRLNRRIQIYATTTVSDGSGGADPLEALQFETWASVSRIGQGGLDRLTSYGLSDLQSAVQIVIRRRPDFDVLAPNLHVYFKGDRYSISAADDLDVERRFLRLFCQKQVSSEPIEIAEGGQRGFPYTFD